MGRGLYTISEAERLTGVPGQRIRRWTGGYTFAYGGSRHYSPPPIATNVQRVDGAIALDFSDLMEVRFLNAFRDHGVSWRAIRIASERARELIGRHRPFSSRIFKTDGHTIMAELVLRQGDKALLDLVKNQYAFEEVISPYLYSGIVFDDFDEPQLWHPLEAAPSVVVDPRRAFGAPIVRPEGVPTRVLYNAYGTDRSIPGVATWYEVSEASVRDAILFEERMAA